MQLFIYKIYYTLFLYYSKHKGETPWFKAQIILTICFGSLSAGILGTFRLLSPLKALFQIPNTSVHLNKYIFVFFLVFSIWKGLSYLLYKKMQISKVDGKSPLFEFTPTKKDNISTWMYVLILLLSSIIITGIEAAILAIFAKT